MLDPEIARKTLSRFGVEDRPSILEAVRLGNESKVELETWGFFCACLAWGNMITKRDLLINFYKDLPVPFTEFVMKPSYKISKKIYKTEVGVLQLQGLCLAIRDLLEEYKSIGKLVSECKSVTHAIFRLAYEIRKRLDKHSPARKFNLPNVNPIPPITEREKKVTSALKRYCMYFRWMVRDTEPDFGI